MSTESPKDLISFIKSIKLFKELNDEEIRQLFTIMTKKTYSAGEYIIREGEIDQTLLILESGKAEIIKERPPNPPFQIATVEPGETFGEMSLFEPIPRSASVKALEKSEVLIFDIRRVENLYNKTLKGLGLKLSAVIRNTDQNLVALLEEKIEDFNLRTQASNLFIVMILSAAFYISTEQVYIGIYKTLNSVAISAFGFGVITFQAIAAVLIIKKSKYPLSFYGLTLKNWPQEVYQAIMRTIPVLFLFTMIKWILITTIPKYHSAQLIELFPEKTEYSNLYLAFSIIYLLLIPLQEFVVRGCFQGCLRNFFVNRNRVLISILGSNLLFASEHAIKSMLFAIGVFFTGIFWGYLYEEQKSLVGVIISHAMIGIWAFFFLNLIQFFVL